MSSLKGLTWYQDFKCSMDNHSLLTLPETLRINQGADPPKPGVTVWRSPRSCFCNQTDIDHRPSSHEERVTKVSAAECEGCICLISIPKWLCQRGYKRLPQLYKVLPHLPHFLVIWSATLFAGTLTY